jgi:hypothetical protein
LQHRGYAGGSRQVKPKLRHAASEGGGESADQHAGRKKAVISPKRILSVESYRLKKLVVGYWFLVLGRRSQQEKARRTIPPYKRGPIDGMLIHANLIW